MAEVSKDDSKPDEAELDKLYYYHLWKQRLGWTRHIIPVRAYHAETGFFVEAYASIVSAVSDIEGQKAELKLAFLPTEIFDIIFAKITDIYPTARNLTLIKEDQLLDVEKTVKYLPKKKISIGKLKKLFIAYKGCSFTLKELENMLNNEIPDSDQQFLEKDGTKHCSIEAKEATAYSGMGSAKVVLEATDLSDVQVSFSGLQTTYKACTACDLGTKRCERDSSLDVTPGRLGLKTWGDIPEGAEAEVMIIGEAPGIYEEGTGLALDMRSPSGGVLRKVLDAAGFDQGLTYYTNAVLCRPSLKDKEAQNDKPADEYIAACNERLKNEIALIRPKVVVLLGKIAYKSFFGEEPSTVLNSSGWKNKEETVYFAPHPTFVVRELSFAEPDKTGQIKSDYLSHFKRIMARVKKLKK
mgnify:CR=1 FL=1|tara:strand:- start:189464 stop:190696 length:1233 start_codon:yes stop_codon:yes gene_type:complete